MPDRPDSPPDLPLTVLAGYLGAGKTTLLNAVLSEPHGQRIAVLVNDFGSVDVDGALVAAHDGTTISMANGCACCTVGDDLGAAILRVRDAGSFDRVVLEASGVADPARLAEWGSMPGLTLDAVIVLADATTIEQRAADGYVGSTVRHQLESADVLVLTKVDLVDDDRRAAAEATLRRHNPSAPVVATQGRAPLAVLLGPHDRSATASHVAPEQHDAVHVTVTTSATAMFQEEELTAHLATAPGLVRAKGIVRCTRVDGTSAVVVVQHAGRRTTVSPAPADAPLTGLVLIGVRGACDLHALAARITGA